MYGESLDTFITKGSWYRPFTVMIITILLVRIHPEPADACCKCFEDGVAFAGVFIGVKIGQWRSPVMHSSTIEEMGSADMTVFILKLAVKLVLGKQI
jgi:dihydrosphingosine 1-phosphate phosphatase